MSTPKPKPQVRFTLGEALLAKNPKLTIGPLAPPKNPQATKGAQS